METFIKQIRFIVLLPVVIPKLAVCQDLTPDSFMRNYIDLRTCDWNQRMCRTGSFINSNIEVVKQSHQIKCVKDLDLDGNLRGYDVCNPLHRSRSWYNDFCLVKGYVHFNVSCEELLKKRIECQYEEMCPVSACRRSQSQASELSNNDTYTQPSLDTATTVSQQAMDIKKLMQHQVNLYIAIGVLSAAVVGLALPHIIHCFRKRKQTQETTDLEQQGRPEIKRLTSQQPDDASDKDSSL